MSNANTTNITNTERYRQIVEETFSRVRELASIKGAEYAAEGDRLDNFRRNGVNNGVTMETCWSVYAGKHWDAIQTYVRDLQLGIERPRSEPMASRADDLIVYLTLFKLMLEERCGLGSAEAETFGDTRTPTSLGDIYRAAAEAAGYSVGVDYGKEEAPQADIPCDCPACTADRIATAVANAQDRVNAILAAANEQVSEAVGFATRIASITFETATE